MNQRKKTCLYLAAIFCAGLLAGGVLGSSLTKRAILQPPHPQALASRIEKELVQKLGLDATQQKKTRLLIDGSITRIMGIYFESIWKIDSELLAAQDALISDLTPEQKTKLKDLAKDRQEFLRNHAPVAPTGL